MKLYTIGFAKKTAEEFFTLIIKNKINILVDVRLNNKSQLAGFTKANDLRFFLKEICHCEYAHCDEFAPTKEILDSYRQKNIDWNGYVERYLDLMNKRGDYFKFSERFTPYNNVVLLCSEPTSSHCHRRLLSEMLCEVDSNITLHHI